WNGVNLSLNTPTVLNYNFNGPDNSIDMSTPGRYTYVLQDNGYANAALYVGYTTNAPVTISHNAATQTTVANAIGTVTATLSSTPSTEERFFVRYRSVNNNFTTTNNLVE